MSAYHRLFEHALTRLEPERAHELGFRAIRAAAPALRRVALPGPAVQTLGLSFPNLLGVAAGFDKQAVGIDALAGLGFGHVEIGTVTARAQPGNPRPRLFRLVGDRAVVNRMGFNNDGAVAVAVRLARREQRLGRRHGDDATRPVLGVNIGKSKVVPDDEVGAVLDDYATSARLLAPYADYLVVNVSSPNTPGLRNLQAVERLAPLLARVREVADSATAVTARRVPLLVKIAPDLTDDDVLAVADLAVAGGLDGIVATNTTTARPPELALRSHPGEIAEIGAGGLSGRPLAPRALEVLALLRGRVGPQMGLIGVGGIATEEDARARLAAGADLLQTYTAFVYEGPLWPRRLVKGLSR